MGLAVAAERRVGRAMFALARLMAWGGGLLLCALALMTVVSITGRRLDGLGLGPIPGDYELVANGAAIAIFSFLPWCQLTRGHVSVDILTRRLPPRWNAAFGLLGDALIAVASLAMLRQFWLGFAQKFPYGSDAQRAWLGMGYRPFFPETTYELQIPVWILHLAAFGGLALFCLVSLYTVWRGINWVLAGEEAAL
ncbi:TRAP transporter small permease [Poseidonocella sedimentorum]|uniref:TRAP transporter small permease protein n=1 Tax=Poseidonocella sedimentorum TaxID=871652 RepID=A0A1I6DZJ4_9RHOB|nr:TRAP transporter small permease [Poseidonocella sedimentorum]SFR10950.1 Tripartite ATP-independent transporter, DctQ component [Poseidonocella sedimentorum]